MKDQLSRRAFLRTAGLFSTSVPVSAQSPESLKVIDLAQMSNGSRFHAEDFNIVGLFDVDWLPDPRFTRLLDNFAASPGGFRMVRFFGALNSGVRENTFPQSSGDVWQDPTEAIDFTTSFNAISELVSRGLIPFVSLTFFPRAVSPSPIMPPASFGNWKHLIQVFLEQLADRFGRDAVARWWFEAWNEPNMPPFWAGSFEQYLALYRATSEAVRETGLRVRLGGPAIAYMPGGEGTRLTERFLSFVASDPMLKCDYISIHRKGTWTNEEGAPDLRRSVDAVHMTAQAAQRLDAKRFRNLVIINDEADMLVGFDRPFEPRMTEQFASWLSAQTVAYDQLTEKYQGLSLRFAAASDNANQQLVQSPFDGRRSIMTCTGRAADDLIKLPVYGFYETIRVLAEHRAVALTPEATYPNTDVYHVATTGAGSFSALFTYYPDPAAPIAGQRRVDYTISGIPWPRTNVSQFTINREQGNAYTAAGRILNPKLDSESIKRVRQAQEVAIANQADRPVQNGKIQLLFDLEPYATVLWLLTPYAPGTPLPPQGIQAERVRSDVILRWNASNDPGLLGYQVSRTEGMSSPLLRCGLWIDTDAGPHPIEYSILAVSTSGVRSTAQTIRA
ncbi:MAG: hypothetical protein JOY71_08760 [Acetobacteraceae bacterium]|nr:hypothetical protein [Acetobacteraceae bacterium]